MKIHKIILGVFLWSVCTCPADNMSIDRIFDRKYSEWKSWISEHSYASTYTACKEYNDIVELGIPAVHLMFGKIEDNEDDFHLSAAIRRITKRRFDKNEWPKGKLGDSRTAARMFVRWWRVDRFQTGKRFRELYDKWKVLRDENKRNADDVYRQIVNLGIPVLPHLADVVDEHPEFIAAVSELTDGELPADVTADKCKEWWQQNKSRFELPSPGPGKLSFPRTTGKLPRTAGKRIKVGDVEWIGLDDELSEVQFRGDVVFSGKGILMGAEYPHLYAYKRAGEEGRYDFEWLLIDVSKGEFNVLNDHQFSAVVADYEKAKDSCRSLAAYTVIKGYKDRLDKLLMAAKQSSSGKSKK